MPTSSLPDSEETTTLADIRRNHWHWLTALLLLLSVTTVAAWIPDGAQAVTPSSKQGVSSQSAITVPPDSDLLGRAFNYGGMAVFGMAMFWLLREENRRHSRQIDRITVSFTETLEKQRASCAEDIERLLAHLIGQQEHDRLLRERVLIQQQIYEQKQQQHTARSHATTARRLVVVNDTVLPRVEPPSDDLPS